jgi:hypothetical protein
MRSYSSWSLVCLAALSAALAGCAVELADPKNVTESSGSCVGVAPTTGSMLRKKEDCAAEKTRAPLSEAEIQELKQRNGVFTPRAGGGNAQ